MSKMAVGLSGKPFAGGWRNMDRYFTAPKFEVQLFDDERSAFSM